MAKDDESSFLTSLPAVLTAIGTLVAGAAGLIALFVTSGSGKPPAPAANTSAAIVTPGNAGSASSTPTARVANVTDTPADGGPTGTGPTVGPTVSRTISPTTAPPSVPVISAVSFTGNTATPTVIVSGQGFGTSPSGQLDNATSCGSYTNNGDDFGTNSLWFQDNGNFAAGLGTPPTGSCIGIIVLSWSNDQVVYQFGNAYNSFDHWYISPGDPYTLAVRGAQYQGTASFS